ncbi:hypothetical protein F4778DRAFT_780440 [Xylariomycetidae sp. FL2044]|nr:hypothetical protein F4778DRAFT_780440 [Xylariomycetidae sp. FL2044]
MDQTTTTTASAHHRKIELQAPEDLAYLLANVRRAAAAHVNEAFPPVDGAQGEDELRTRIEELVNEYITKTFTLASPNLSINGLPVDPSHFLSSSSGTSTTGGPAAAAADPTQPEEIYEPFDGRKRARVEDLTREEEDLLRDIAQLKRSVPSAAAAAWADGFRRGIAGDEEALLAAVAVANSPANADGGGNEEGRRAGGEEGGGTLDVHRLERQDDVEKTYDGAVRGLSRLKKEMPAVVARMERARGAGEYVVTER